jgi:hypothetical protein
MTLNYSSNAEENLCANIYFLNCILHWPSRNLQITFSVVESPFFVKSTLNSALLHEKTLKFINTSLHNITFFMLL